MRRRKRAKQTEGETAKSRARATLSLALFAVLLLGLLSFQPDPASPWLYSFLGWEELLSNGLIALVTLALLLLYLHYRQPELKGEGRSLAFLGGLILTIMILDKVGNLFSPYLTPVAFAVGLAVIFLGAEIGLLTSVALALLAGLGGDFSPPESLVALGGGLTMLLGLREIRRGGDLALAMAGIGVALVNMILLLATSVSFGFAGLSWNAVGWAGANGLISYLLILGGIPLSEYLTDKTSPLGLMELLSPSHPLMERLQREAPGTYHHSSSIAQLGANAARAIGADPLLTEVGGHYHDVGKLDNPGYFAENQEEGNNPHDELSPSMSKLILTAHVRKGLELGHSYGLREDVLRFIPEHHGTSAIRYFYLKALQEHKDEEILIDDYRYEAARPRSKETAIIMLADSVEAAARVAESERLEDVIAEQINAKLEDGQLDRSPLTIADLHRIKRAFYETLRAMRHRRPEGYPRASET